MNKKDFITNLQHALAGGLPGGQVAENVRYYREYIDSEIHRGSTEEEVLAAVEKAILLFRDKGQAGERFADTIARIGFEEADRLILSDELLQRKEEILAEE